MRKIAIVMISLVLCAVLLTGCGDSNKEPETAAPVANDQAVLGTWSEDYFDSGYTFNEDGTGRDTFWDLPFTYTAHDGVITITYDDETYGVDKYSYTVSESEITMTRQADDGKSFTYHK